MTRDALSGPDGTQALPPLLHYPDALTVARAVPPTTTSAAPLAPPPAVEPEEPFSLPPARRPNQPAQQRQKKPKKKQRTSVGARIGCLLALAIPLLVILAALFG
ncbi:hypothetical protein SAMN02982929_04114 [Saccharopolyspora kobensis]|uniref:Uncharacterized protein n=1 Tax=Saccharopolyspora kobensis TaxID=146035 RepID=A0A1H6DCH8_9PSEU|nr:hypothetical protein [Saccharopolyspora kobensis]SEG82533.1 hypothetical protein SAMN02982929_04114 [Saccharopolyspora kobensis]SFE24898.1 hypothetical protein SAMN05216506_11031 [Saccharopolyspora kobensis]